MGGSQEATGRRNQKATGRRSQEIGRERSSGEEGGGQALRGESFQEGSQSHQAQGTQGREIQRGGEEGKEQEREAAPKRKSWQSRRTRAPRKPNLLPRRTNQQRKRARKRRVFPSPNHPPSR